MNFTCTVWVFGVEVEVSVFVVGGGCMWFFFVMCLSCCGSFALDCVELPRGVG